MISNTIVRTARFLKMPPTTQNLYFHSVLNADDDGVVEAFPVMRLIGATEDDLKILVEKEFVYLLNDDLVTYIKDWNEQNTIRADRKVDSIYKELLLSVVPEVDYKTSKKKSSQPVVRQMTDNSQTNDRLSQDKLSQDKLSQDKLSQDKLVVNHSLKPIQIFYENNGFGTLSSKTIQDFNYWIDDFKNIGSDEENALELIIHAMKLAVDNNVRKYSYVNSILKNWEQKRLVTVEQIEAMEKEREQTKQQQPHRASNMPDYSTWVKTGDDF